MDCNNSASIQGLLTAPQLRQLTAKAAAACDHYALRCSACGLVYAGNPPIRLGWLDGTEGPGFHPAPEYA